MSTRSQQPKRREGLRNHVLSSSPRYSDMKISKPMPHPLPGQEVEDPTNPDTKSHSSTSLDSLFQQTRSSLRSSSQNTPSRTPQQTRGVGISAHAAQDSISSNISGSPVLHRRRGSTLKTVMRKIFGRKRRSDGEDVDFILENPDDLTRPTRPPWVPDLQEIHGQRSPQSANSRSRRSMSLQNQRGSIKSSPCPSALAVTEPSPTPGTSDPVFSEGLKRRRRATLPSMVLSTYEANDLASRIGQNSSAAESVRSLPKERTSVDSPVRKPSLQDRRRSRSAYGLRETARAHRMSPIQWRRRSAEIKYWRTSMLKMSEIPSVAALPEPQDAADVVIEEPNIGNASNADNDIPQNNSFDLGAFMGNMQGDQDIHLAQRVATLEVKLMDLEFAISKLQGQNIPSFSSSSFGNSVKKAPTSPNKHDSDGDVSPIPGSGPFVSSFSSTPTGTPPQTSYHPEERHGSVSTLRPHTSAQHLSPAQAPPSPYLTSSDFSGISVEQYSALTTLVRREQSARKLLESQLLQMQKEMQQLLPNKGDRRSSIYNGTFLYPSSPTSPGPTSFSSMSRQDTGQSQTERGSRNESYSHTSESHTYSRQMSYNQMPGMI